MITTFARNYYNTLSSMYIPANSWPNQNGYIEASESSDKLTVSNGKYINYSLWIKPDWGTTRSQPINFFYHECVPNLRNLQQNYYPNYIAFFYDSETEADCLHLIIYEAWDVDYVTHSIHEVWAAPVSGINQAITGIPQSGTGRGSWKSGGFVNIQVEYVNRFQDTGQNIDNAVAIRWNNSTMTMNPVSRTYFINGVGQFPTPSNIGIDFRNFKATDPGSTPAIIDIGARFWEGGYWMDKFMFDPNQIQWNSTQSSNVYGNGSPGTYTTTGTVAYYDFSSSGNWYNMSSGSAQPFASTIIQGSPIPNQDNTNYVS